jgi:hypothetical protein
MRLPPGERPASGQSFNAQVVESGRHLGWSYADPVVDNSQISMVSNELSGFDTFIGYGEGCGCPPASGRDRGGRSTPRLWNPAGI